MTTSSAKKHNHTEKAYALPLGYECEEDGVFTPYEFLTPDVKSDILRMWKG